MYSVTLGLKLIRTVCEMVICCLLFVSKNNWNSYRYSRWLLYLLQIFPHMNAMHAVCPTAGCYHLNCTTCDVFVNPIPLDLLLVVVVQPELFHTFNMAIFGFFHPHFIFMLEHVWCGLHTWQYWRFVNSRTCIMMYFFV